MKAVPTEMDLDWFERLPKVELHVHLEGAIPHQALWDLLQKYGGDPEIPTREALAGKFVYRDFPHFLDTWTWKNGLLRQYEDFEFLAGEVANDFAGQHIRYAEVFYSPADFLSAGLEPQRLTEAIRRGLNRVPSVEVGLVADLVRDYGPERGARTLACVSEVRGLGVVGVGMGGSEHSSRPRRSLRSFAAPGSWASEPAHTRARAPGRRVSGELSRPSKSTASAMEPARPRIPAWSITWPRTRCPWSCASSRTSQPELFRTSHATPHASTLSAASR